MSNYSFAHSLAKGAKGEALLLKLWPELERLDGRKADFICPDGQTLELKSDSYDMADTANYFIERYSDVAAGKVGGPFQAFGRGATLFAYMYMPNKEVHIFDTATLCKEVQRLEKLGQVKPTEIHNSRWVTIGYKIERAKLAHLLLRVIKA